MCFLTQIHNNQGTAISNIFVDISRLNSPIVLHIAIGLSDHDAKGKWWTGIA